MRRIMDLNTTIDCTYELYRKHYGSFIGYTMLMSLVLSVIMYAIVIVIAIFGGVLGMALFAVSPGYIGTFVMVFFIVVIVGIPAAAITKVINAGYIDGVSTYQKGEAVTFGNMFGFGFKNFFYVVTSTYAYYFCLSSIIAVGALIYLAFHLVVLPDYSTAYPYIVGAFIGLITLIALVYFMIRAAFYMNVAVCGKQHFFSALKGSFQLTKNRFKETFALLFTNALAYGLVYITIGGLSSMLSQGLSLYSSQMESVNGMVVIMLIQLLLLALSFLSTAAVSSIPSIGIQFMYVNARNRLYGTDMVEAIDRLAFIASTQQVAEGWRPV